MPQITNQEGLPNYYGSADKSIAEAADSAHIEMKLAFGANVSLAVATCQPGYHPAPQLHASEQLNYIAEGELWVYIDKDAYHLKQGDAIRIPRGKVHWMWNRSEKPCTFYESNAPALAGDAHVQESRGALFDDDTAAHKTYPRVVWLSDKYSKEVEEKNDAPIESPLMARAANMTISVHGGAIGAAAAGKLTSKTFHGLESNMTIATRKGSYHSLPHIHDTEQVHYQVTGQINIYTTQFGFALKQGDFNIIPPNTPHWAHVKTDDDNILLQAFSPVLGSAANRVALLTDEERRNPIHTVFNMTPWREREIAQVEEKHETQMRRSV